MYSLSRYILRPNQAIVLKLKKGKAHKAEWGKNFLYFTCMRYYGLQDQPLEHAHRKARVANKSKRA
jgi:hypothetical protein